MKKSHQYAPGIRQILGQGSHYQSFNIQSCQITAIVPSLAKIWRGRGRLCNYSLIALEIRDARWHIFRPKPPIFGTFLKALEWKILIPFITIWYILLSFLAVWYIFCSFVTFSPIWCFDSRAIWQPCLE
jgi:hypothetical protein